MKFDERFGERNGKNFERVGECRQRDEMRTEGQRETGETGSRKRETRRKRLSDVERAESGEMKG